MPSTYKLQSLDSKDRDALLSVYQSLYPQLAIEVKDMAEILKKFSTISLRNQRYGSKLECRSLRSAWILASWGNEEHLRLDSLSFVAGYVLFLFPHSIKLGQRFVEHVFACTVWQKEDEDPEQFGNPTKTWKLNKYVAHGPSRFLPVERIYCRYSAAEILLDGETKTCLCST